VLLGSTTAVVPKSKLAITIPSQQTTTQLL
jgi:hypothetical protein